MSLKYEVYMGMLLKSNLTMWFNVIGFLISLCILSLSSPLSRLMQLYLMNEWSLSKIMQPISRTSVNSSFNCITIRPHIISLPSLDFNNRASWLSLSNNSLKIRFLGILIKNFYFSLMHLSLFLKSVLWWPPLLTSKSIFISINWPIGSSVMFLLLTPLISIWLL